MDLTSKNKRWIDIETLIDSYLPIYSKYFIMIDYKFHTSNHKIKKNSKSDNYLPP